MSTAKHTPGPWQAAGKHICQDDGGVVGYVTAYAMPTPRQQADARLMAAAPELLEALQKAKNSLVAFKFMPGPGNAWEDSDEANLNAVDAAIAKATGSAS